MEISFISLQIYGIQDKHLRVDAEGHCHLLKGVAVTGEVGSTQGMSLLKEKILWLVTSICAHHGVSTHYYCSGSLGVSRNILGAGGHILWLGGR